MKLDTCLKELKRNIHPLMYDEIIGLVGEGYGSRKPIQLHYICEKLGLETAIEVLKIFPTITGLMAALFAERVLHIYEKEHPSDSSQSIVIEKIRNEHKKDTFLIYAARSFNTTLLASIDPILTSNSHTTKEHAQRYNTALHALEATTAISHAAAANCSDNSRHMLYEIYTEDSIDFDGNIKTASESVLRASRMARFAALIDDIDNTEYDGDEDGWCGCDCKINKKEYEWQKLAFILATKPW